MRKNWHETTAEEQSRALAENEDRIQQTTRKTEGTHQTVRDTALYLCHLAQACNAFLEQELIGTAWKHGLYPLHDAFEAHRVGLAVLMIKLLQETGMDKEEFLRLWDEQRKERDEALKEWREKQKHDSD